MPTFDVVAIGLATVDFLARVPAGARAGGKTAVTDLAVEGGGPAANAAAVTGALGFATALYAGIGDDDVGQLLRLQLRRHGISEALLSEQPASRTPSAVIEVDAATAERTVFYCVAGYCPPPADRIPVAAIADARVVLVDTYAMATAEATLAAARDAGVPAVLDYEAADPATARRLIGLASHVILPAESVRAITGCGGVEPALAAMASWTDGQVVVTDGARGSWARTAAGRVHHQPAFPIAAIDTTGCGDAYHGAYAVGLLEAWPLAERLEFAAWVASRVAGHLGGRAGLPDRRTLAALTDPQVTPALRSKLEALGHRAP